MASRPAPGGGPQALPAPAQNHVATAANAYRNICLTYDVRPEEQVFRDNQEPTIGQNFRYFCIGYRLSGGRYQSDTILRWQNADESERSRLIGLAHKFPDPRRKHGIYLLGPKEKALCDELPKTRRPEFLRFMLAIKATASVQLKELTEDRFINLWRQGLHFNTMVALGALIEEGKEAFKKDSQAAEQREGEDPPPHVNIRESGPRGHHHDKNNRRPSASDRDRIHVNKQLESWRHQGNWVFEKTLYENGNSNNYRRIVHLFASVDDNDNVVERVVVKIQGYETVEYAKRQTNHEYKIQRLLTNTRCQHIAELFGQSVRTRAAPPHLGYGFMEYAPFGDLCTLLNRYFTSNNPVQVPEPFIWMVFRGLAEAIYAMLTGEVVDAAQPDTEKGLPNDELKTNQNWTSIVNFDIKPLNVVLSHSSPRYPSYKTAKMIDFGCARTPPGGKINFTDADKTAGLGTEGFRPPEQMDPRFISQRIKARASEGIDVRSHIFNLGLIIRSLMNGREMLYGGKFNSKLTHDLGYDNAYTNLLEDLVFKCLDLNPSGRATLHHILWATREGLRRWEKAYGSLEGKTVDELIPPARMEFVREEHPIGGRAPERMRKRRSNAEAGPADPQQPPAQRPRLSFEVQRIEEVSSVKNNIDRQPESAGVGPARPRPAGAWIDSERRQHRPQQESPPHEEEEPPPLPSYKGKGKAPARNANHPGDPRQIAPPQEPESPEDGDASGDDASENGDASGGEDVSDHEDEQNDDDGPDTLESTPPSVGNRPGAAKGPPRPAPRRQPAPGGRVLRNRPPNRPN